MNCAGGVICKNCTHLVYDRECNLHHKKTYIDAVTGKREVLYKSCNSVNPNLDCSSFAKKASPCNWFMRLFNMIGG